MSVQQTNEDNPDEAIFEKKYFDYLPNDLDSEDVTDEDAVQESVQPFDVVSSEKNEDNSKRVNSRKFKRDLADQSPSRFSHDRVKRQSIYYIPIPWLITLLILTSTSTLHPPSQNIPPPHPSKHDTVVVDLTIQILGIRKTIPENS